MIKSPALILKATLICCSLSILIACKGGNSNVNGSKVADSVANVDSVKPKLGENPTPGTDSIFNINSVPITTVELGQFPYLNLPETYTYNYDKEISQASIKDIDKEYFAVYGKLIPEEGKTFKATLEKNRADGKRFNSLELQKSLDQSISDLGGIKLKTVVISNKEWEELVKKSLLKRDMDSQLMPIV